jgi:predicted house-cleaning noncanonical NTP pyrophosphatase (MazG superfamily)
MPGDASGKFAGGYPIKLVRDHIGHRLGGDGTITYEPIGDRDMHVALLRRKLVEEAAEYLADPTLAELADVMAVVWALARVDLGVAPFDVERAMNAKTWERGGFDQGMVMVGHHAADGRELLPREVPDGQ